MNPITFFAIAAAAGVGTLFAGIGIGMALWIAAAGIAHALKMVANTWQKFVVLRPGKLHGAKGRGRKTSEWGVTVTSVEIRDVAVPVALQGAVSRQTQAEREKPARVILGAADGAIAGKFVEAAKIYAEQPAALQLRAMNIIDETTQERVTTILIPTSMVDSTNPAAAVAVLLSVKKWDADVMIEEPLH